MKDKSKGRLTSTQFMTSIVCGLHHKIGHEKRFEKMVNGKYGMKLRKLTFYDLEIPLDNERYNKSINFLKPFMDGALQKVISLMPFKKFIKKKLKKMDLSFMNITKQFQHQANHPLNYCGFCPLLLDERYLNFKFNGKYVYTQEQKDNLIRLRTFESKGYKPIINGIPTDESLLIDSEDLI